MCGGSNEVDSYYLCCINCDEKTNTDRFSVGNVYTSDINFKLSYILPIGTIISGLRKLCSCENGNGRLVIVEHAKDIVCYKCAKLRSKPIVVYNEKYIPIPKNIQELFQK